MSPDFEKYDLLNVVVKMGYLLGNFEKRSASDTAFAMASENTIKMQTGPTEIMNPLSENGGSQVQGESSITLATLDDVMNFVDNAVNEIEVILPLQSD